MGALLFVVSIVFVAALLLAVTWRFGPLAKVGTAIALYFVLTADSTVGHYMLDQACSSDLNVEVAHRAERVQGVRFSFPYSIQAESAEFYGYEFVEAPSRSATEPRRSIFVDGKKGYSPSETSDVRYELRRAESEGRGLTIRTYSVSDVKSGVELGKARWFFFRGGWLERVTDRYFSDGGPRQFVATCRRESEYEQIRALLRATLSPLER